jgi:hypothetical protein
MSKFSKNDFIITKASLRNFEGEGTIYKVIKVNKKTYWVRYVYTEREFYLIRVEEGWEERYPITYIDYYYKRFSKLKGLLYETSINSR